MPTGIEDDIYIRILRAYGAGTSRIQSLLSTERQQLEEPRRDNMIIQVGEVVRVKFNRVSTEVIGSVRDSSNLHGYYMVDWFDIRCDTSVYQYAEVERLI